MIVEKISMVDALNMEMKELMNSYKQQLENMSKEELISEIGNLLADKGILLGDSDYHINELKTEIEQLTKRENELVEDKAHWINKWKEQVEYTEELQKQMNELKVEMHKIERAANEIYMLGVKEGSQQAVKDTTNDILQGFMKWLNQAISNSYEKSVNGSVHYGGMNTAFHEVKELVKKVAESKGVEVE